MGSAWQVGSDSIDAVTGHLVQVWRSLNTPMEASGALVTGPPIVNTACCFFASEEACASKRLSTPRGTARCGTRHGRRDARGVAIAKGSFCGRKCGETYTPLYSASPTSYQLQWKISMLSSVAKSMSETHVLSY